MASEADRINNVYNNYSNDKKVKIKWSSDNIGNKLMLDELFKEINKKLMAEKFNIVEAKMLEVGCAGGNIISGFRDLGVLDKNIFGIDLRKSRLDEAKKMYPSVKFHCMDAQKMNFKDSFFDIITVFTLFSSVLDKSIKLRIANEIRRVLKTSGIIIYYDIRYKSFNKFVSNLNKNDIMNLFPKMNHEIKAITLIPPLSRLLGDYSKILYPILSSIHPLKSHYFDIITKK